MTAPLLTTRQLREREYYDTFAQHRGTPNPDFSPVAAGQRRPWNPYWRLFQLVQERFTPNSQLLDFGCGWGVNTLVFAEIGYRVDGFDISPKNVEAALELVHRHGMQDRVSVRVDTAERLSYPDASFDVVAGIDILHHVEVNPAVSEVRRILKPGGVAFFREPVVHPIFDLLRNSSLVKSVWPNDKSFERHITDDERKLGRQDFSAIVQSFPNMRTESFRMLSRLDAILPRSAAVLERLDYSLNGIPGFSWWRGTAIFILEKQRTDC